METGARKMNGAIMGQSIPKQLLRLVVQRSPFAGMTRVGAGVTG